MPILTLLAWLLALAGVVIAVRAFMPESAQPIKKIIVWVLAAIAVWLILDAFGVIDILRGMRTPRL